MASHGDLVVADDSGLRCTRGGFHVDPWSPVERAVVTHAHADHARPGSGLYLATRETIAIMRARLGGEVRAQEIAYGERVRVGDVTVSLHPAGHVLGSAQVLIEPDSGPTWCISGDYKIEPDATCRAFECQRCDVFVTESTFGLPVFRWDPDERVTRAINAWRSRNAAEGRASVLMCYSLGKAQRVLASLDGSIGPIGLHGAVRNVCEVYRAHGVAFPECVHANAETADGLRGGTILAPPSAAQGAWLRRFAGENGARRAMVSGWMAIRGRRKWRAVDQGFVLSDHADWPGLLETIDQTGAQRVLATHGYASQLSRYLREIKGLDAGVLATRFGDDEEDEHAGVSSDADRSGETGRQGSDG